MFTPSSGNSNINLKNILNRKKEKYDFEDSDTVTIKNEKNNNENKLRNTYNKNSANDIDAKPKITSKTINRSLSSESNSSLSSGKLKKSSIVPFGPIVQ